MANSPEKNKRRSLRVAFAALGLLGVAVAAQERSAEKIVLETGSLDINHKNNTAVMRDLVITQGTMRIEAKEARVKGGLDFENGEWTISGDVRIKAENGNLKSDKAVVSFANNLISRAVVTGSPAEFEQQREDGSTARGRAGTIAYEPGSGVVSFRENAFLSDGCNELKGQQLRYNIKQQRVEGQAQPTPGANGRITITIQPKGDSGTGNPCAKPGSRKTP
jgi:lipopolysaccharide transport protein LptA